MADETPPDSPRKPVRMGLRVVARHSAGRGGCGEGVLSSAMVYSSNVTYSG